MPFFALGGDGLCRSTVDGVLVQLGVNQADVHALDGFVCNGAFYADFVERLDDEFASFVEVLDTFGVVDEHVGSVDGVDLPHGVLVHAVFAEFVPNLPWRRAANGSVAEFPSKVPDDFGRSASANFKEETVVSVWRFALKCVSTVGALDAFSVNDDGRADLDLDVLFFLDSVNGDFKGGVHPMPASNASPVSWLVVLQRCVGLGKRTKSVDELKVLHALWFNGHGDHRVRIVSNGLKGREILVAGERHRQQRNECP